MSRPAWSTRLQSFLTRQNGIALGLLLLSGLIYGWLVASEEVNVLSPQGLKQAVADTGLTGILIYMGIIALSVVISPIPGAPLAVAAGAVWGAIPAAIYSVIGGFFGGLVAYFIARTLGRSAMRALTGKVVYFSKDRGEWYLGLVIFATRLLPVLSFDLVSYAAGLTGLSLPIFMIATLLGMIPSTFLLTYMGTAFTLQFSDTIAYFVVFLIVLFGLPWGIRRYNWFGMRDIVKWES